MSSMNEITVILRTDKHALLAEKAQDFLDELSSATKANQSDERRDATCFLSDLVGRRSWQQEGMRAVVRMSAWSIEGNYSEVEDFIRFLSGFWRSLFRGFREAVFETDTSDVITVLGWHESAQNTHVYTIWVDENDTLMTRVQYVDMGRV